MTTDYVNRIEPFGIVGHNSRIESRLGCIIIIRLSANLSMHHLLEHINQDIKRR